MKKNKNFVRLEFRDRNAPLPTIEEIRKIQKCAREGKFKKGGERLSEKYKKQDSRYL